MKKKLLDTALIGILAGMSAAAPAQETASTQQATPAQQTAPTTAAIECDGDACNSENGDLVFRVRTRSYDQPVTSGTSERSSSATLQPDRRVSIALDEPGRAVASGDAAHVLRPETLSEFYGVSVTVHHEPDGTVVVVPRRSPVT